ncbi:MAG: hypothetical protein VR65_26165 [Desulfobulbaceae bacterium BRH_c16a]|nr:MAG: hypothetical protein VR65_26165 [Desulfobulbaceae bacterium BRH_c16a]
MIITSETKIHEVLNAYPFLEDFMVARNLRYKNLKNPLMRETIGRIASLGKVAGIGGENVAELVEDIRKEIERHGREGFSAFAGKKFVDPIKQNRLKEIIQALHRGEDLGKLKEQFAALSQGVTATEIADLEQSLMDEGMPEKEVRRLCDLHVAVFEDSLGTTPVPDMPPGHPVHTFMLENRETEKIIAQLTALIRECGEPQQLVKIESVIGQFQQHLTNLEKVNVHYTRKENQLFPLLEKHGVTAPSKVMWSIHDDIRGLVKQAKRQLADRQHAEMIATLKDVLSQIGLMIYKEEHILFPMSLDVLDDEDWHVVRQGEAAIGYAWIEPPPEMPAGRPKTSTQVAEGLLEMETGRMSLEMINLMLTNLPVDISLVDENDKVVYYSDSPDRSFPRSPAVIGRSVQNCHPPDSVENVNRILDAFRKGEKRTAEFWISFGGKFIHIRYFALFDRQSRYRGCLEVTQDVTEIRALEGEKRLLDWQ